MAEVAWRSKVRIERVKGSLRHAFLPEVAKVTTEVSFR